MLQLNKLLGRLRTEDHDGLRHIDLLVMRPSEDLGRLANAYEADLPRAFRFLTRGMGTRETRSNDMLSLVMFQKDYVARLLENGRGRSGRPARGACSLPESVAVWSCSYRRRRASASSASARLA